MIHKRFPNGHQKSHQYESRHFKLVELLSKDHLLIAINQRRWHDCIPFLLGRFKDDLVTSFPINKQCNEICFVNKLLSGDVQISEKNILAQDTGRKVSIKNKLDIFRGRQMTDFIDLETL
ncbi:hypothetical protein Tsp_08973 [Trichinella spiralis]|uniref:hypothetical protein n=1 Tax=Trichinella spiralis TaxID=6334 RepID=UPI0001EFC34D|nr:hypothetical protein Tsp_08973 [Trichinella spiralis]